MPKGSFLSDTFEQLAELGVSTVKKSGQAAKQILDPAKALDKITGQEQSGGNGNLSNQEKNQQKKDNHTPLDFQKLQEKYKNQDEIKMKDVKNRLFQLVKSGERGAINEVERDKQEKQKKESYEEQEKRKKEQERTAQEQQAGLPQGKVRKSIFSHKKVAQRQQAEVKPSTGKQ